MCEQTEINYLDGDIVWVKLGACWWPGQVTSFHNLPDDIQIEFQKKPLIAAVKFFQEDTYEFVKNLHQIYKYNCTQKDDFIRKGLDKYRTKSKDGSSYMDKFPGDVEMAEKLTGGDPDILMNEKFCREEKPDISALFGEKKISKRKRERDEINRRNEGGAVMRKITHPRFLRESDHEIRIRQQPSSLPSTPKTPSSDSPQFSCNLCNFTSTRVNVIIYHRKSHCSGGGYESPMGRPRMTNYSQSKSSTGGSRPSLPGETQKRKYVRKTKSLSSKGGKSERDSSEPVKRKLSKQLDKSAAKKKKTDPELREKLLADWDDETDDDMDIDLNKSTADTISIGSPSIGNNSTRPVNSSESIEEKEEEDDSVELIKASEKLLRETEKFTSLHIDDSSSRTSRQSNNKNHEDLDSETDTSTSTLAKDDKSVVYKKPKKLMASIEERKSTSSDKDDKQSRFSCFDFDEEDLPEPTITRVRKIPRIFGEKNTSVKKEILKKFTMSQALKSVKDKEKQDRESDEKISDNQNFFEKKEPTAKEKKERGNEKETLDSIPAKEHVGVDEKRKIEAPTKSSDETRGSRPMTVTELEIVEIFEVEGEKDEREENETMKKSLNYETETFEIDKFDKNTENREEILKIDDNHPTKDTKDAKDTKEDEGTKNYRLKKVKAISTELPTTETEDEMVSELADSLRGASENSDTDGNLNQSKWGVASTARVDDNEKPPPRRGRGRPRKSLPVLDSSGNGNDSPKREIIAKKIASLVARDSERKTSESDSERSYSGRRRKPNKRYLHSEIYTSSPDNRASKTDESQSETEEKSHKEHASARSRREKKTSSSSIIESNPAESIETPKDREFEFSNRTLDTTDRARTIEASDVSKVDDYVSRINSSREIKLDNETEGESSVSCTADLNKKMDVGSSVNITKLLSPGDSEVGTLKQIHDQEDKSEKKDTHQQVVKTVTMITDDVESGQAKSSPKFDKLTNVDKLPPKKSQIKKFELSQIDLLDACAEQVAAEQAAAEKIIADKLAVEKLAAEKIAAEKLAAEILEAEKLAAEKLEAEKLEAEKLEAEKLEAEKLEAEKLEAEKLEAEKLEAEKLEAEKLAAEKLEAEKLAAEKIVAEKLVAEKLEAEKLAAEKLEAEKLAAEKLEAEKLKAEKLKAEKLEAERLEAEKLEAEKLATERLEAEKLAAEKLAASKLAEEEVAAEKIATERLAAEKLAAEKLAAEKLSSEKLAVEKLLDDKSVDEEVPAVEEKIVREKENVEDEVTAEKKLPEERTKDQTCDTEIKLQDVDPNVQVSSEQVKKCIIQSVAIAADNSSSVTDDNVTERSAKDSTMETIEAVLARITNEEVKDKSTITAKAKIPDETKTIDKSKISKAMTKETIQAAVNTETPHRSNVQSRYKGKFTTELSLRAKKDIVDEEIPVNSFQEAFLKTLQIDKKDDKDNESTDLQKLKQSSEKTESQQTLVIAIAGGNNETLVDPSTIRDSQNVQPLNAMTEFEGVEILVQENIVDVDTKINDGNANQMDLAAALVGTDLKQEGAANTLSLDLQKIQDTLSDGVSTPSSPSDISVPVKKREKPRVIGNVALTEPMHLILKNKLLEKLPSKSSKHKLDSEGQKKNDSKGVPRAKMMKMESTAGNSKSRSPSKTGGSHFTVTRKLQMLKAEEAVTTAAMDKEKAAKAQISQTISIPAGGEKFIQQSSQSLADMELDINSMPFVLSEDVLTPESIEHMPVVISSIIPPSSTSVPTTLGLTSTVQLPTTNSEIYKSATTSETATSENTTTSTGKKKSGTPAILKNKGKAKPTITSIRTVRTQFPGGVKGLKFQSQQSTSSSSSSTSTSTGKAMPLISQKSATPGKYVIVQTAGGQQLRYCVQGKPGSTQKIAIPAGKATGSAQIVHQGGKVVILTSAQSGQTKMLPLNISKSMSGKVQKIVNNKAQIYAPISPQGIMGQKTIIAPKTDASLPTTSKLSQGQKILNTQGIITSKGVLTSISSSKSGLLGTLSQGILTKGGIYTPISSAQLAGKTIIGGKTLGSKAATILSSLGSQTIGTSKGTILTPMTHPISGKTIINAQGTVLTPITGQQVKAIAAKSPAKGGNKAHYQSVQQKMQLPMLQKCQKIPVTSSSPIRAGAARASVKSPGGTVVFPNTLTGTTQKTSPGGKKIVRQIAHQGVNSPQTVANVSSPQLILQRGKSSGTTATVQRVAASPRGGGRQTKQKIIVQKMQDASAGGVSGSPIMNMQTKPIMTTSVVGNVTKSTTSHKQTSRTGKSGRNIQKQMSNVTSQSSAIASPAGSNETLVASSASIPTPTPSPMLQSLPVPPLVIPGTELPLNETEGIVRTDRTSDTPTKEIFKHDTANATDATIETPKLEATKIAAQPQIMALPTESSDGTQTYVLVTIDEQGQIQPLDNNTLMSLEGTTQNPDGTRTLYIDPSSLGEAGTLDNIVLQFDNGALPNLQTNVGETSQGIAENFPSTEIIQTSNQDILAAALANTDFQQEIGLPDNTTSNVMTTGLTQTSLINQTILQSTIIPPTEPISSPSVLETSLTLNQPIMTPLEVPSSLPIQVEATPASVVSTIPTSLELPITITDPTISYIAAATVPSETGIRIPGNSMPDIGEIMESSTSTDVAHTDIPASTTQYLVLPTLDDNMTIESRDNETRDPVQVPYTVSITDNIIIDNTQTQTTPSMPIIDDGYVEATEERFAEVTINEMLVPKASSVTDSEIVANDKIEPIDESTEPTIESQDEQSEIINDNVPSFSQVDSYTSQNTAERMNVDQESSIVIVADKETTNEKETREEMQIDEHCTGIIDTCTPAIEESCSAEMNVEAESSRNVESTNHGETRMTNDASIANDESEQDALAGTNVISHKEDFVEHREQMNRSSLDSTSRNIASQVSASMDLDRTIVEESTGMEIYHSENPETSDDHRHVDNSSVVESIRPVTIDNMEIPEEAITDASQEAPSQSYEQFDQSIGGTSDSPEVPTQSAGKSENSREPSQSVAYEAMEIDDNTTNVEPPTQSYVDAKRNEASQSYETTSNDMNTNAPTQSFNEIMQCQDDGEQPSTAVVDDAIDDQSFPTQSYEVGKMDDQSENLESDAVATGQEGNIPSQSNDIGNDGIGTSSITINNSGLNEDETASSSYVPETPENQERDQDQESAISTSSYEIPPCEELNIASSSVIPDTSIRAEHMSIHDNGVPEIPTSSYNLNPDSSSTSHVDTLPTSSYEEDDRVIVEQNVSTSYEVPISMPVIEENSSQNFVTESTSDHHRNEPTSYYARHPEVTASYYEAVNQDSNSRLEADHTQEEVTPSYYEQPTDVHSEASQSYFRSTSTTTTTTTTTTRFDNDDISANYFDTTAETEASQSNYYSHEIEGNEQSSSRNVESSQSFYQETTDERRLGQRGEATPTYTERYPVDYALDNSPIERHDLVESSVPATRPTER